MASVRSRAENKENVRHGIEIMNERKKGAILSYIQVFLSVVVSMIYVPVLLYFLGQSEYGLYQIVGSFFSYVTVFESCVSAGILSCLLYTSPSPRDRQKSRMPSSA